MTRITTALIASLAVLAVAAGPAPAAKRAKEQRSATYTATISGSQVQTWEYHKPDDPDDPCDTANDGYGSQTIKFGSKSRTGKVAAFEVRRGDPLFADTGGRPFIAASVRMNATVDRESDYLSAGETSMCEGDNGGGVVGEPEPRDCGERDGLIDLHVSTTDDEVPDDLFKPLIGKDQVLVGGRVVGYGSTPGSLEGEYRNCEGWIGGPYSESWSAGALGMVLERLPDRKLLSPKTRQLVIDGGDVTCYDQTGPVECGSEAGPFKGRRIVAFKLVLKRRK